MIMSFIDTEGVKADSPDSYFVDPNQDTETVLAKFVVMLHLMDWPYRKIGDLFNRHHERIREIVIASGLCHRDKD